MKYHRNEYTLHLVVFVKNSVMNIISAHIIYPISYHVLYGVICYK